MNNNNPKELTKEDWLKKIRSESFILSHEGTTMVKEYSTFIYKFSINSGYSWIEVDKKVVIQWKLKG